MGRLEGDEGRHGSCNHRRSPHHRCALGVVLLWMLWSTCQTQKTSRGLASTRHQHSTSSSIEYDELQPCASTSRRCSSPIRRGRTTSAPTYCWWCTTLKAGGGRCRYFRRQDTTE